MSLIGIIRSGDLPGVGRKVVALLASALPEPLKSLVLKYLQPNLETVLKAALAMGLPLVSNGQNIQDAAVTVQKYLRDAQGIVATMDQIMDAIRTAKIAGSK